MWGSEAKSMAADHISAVEWIIANTINEVARGDPDELATHIVAALERGGYRIAAILPGADDTVRGPQPFDELMPEMRPQDAHGDGRDWTFETCEHGGDEPDNMPQAITATDPQGRWAVYVPLTRGGKIVIPRPYSKEGY
jgi:hypothetical protein